MRLAWVTDPHLNFVPPAAVDRLAADVAQSGADALLISGDIGEADDFDEHLTRLADGARVPVYFVLGNHDYYRGSIAGVRARSAELCARRPDLVNLSDVGPVRLTAATALVGHDGWGDGRLGNAAASPVVLNDFYLIEELRLAGEAGRLLEELARLGDEAAGHFRRVLPPTFASAGRVIALTHVPPFAGAAWHAGRTSDPDWLPFFACKAAGDAILEAAESHADKMMTVLCGHTHGEGVFHAAANVEVFTGGAEYGRPRVQRVIEAD